MTDGPPRAPRARITIAITTAIAIALAACNVSGLSNQPRATFSQLACLDANGDHRLNAADAADPSKVPDFNADFSHDAQDAAFLRGIDIPLDAVKQAEACKSGSKRAPEYLVAHGFLESSDVDCDSGKQAVLLVGVGGGVVNLRDREDAAGVRSMIDAQQKAWRDAAARWESEPSTGEGRKELMDRARKAEAKRERSMAQYHFYEYATAAFQVAIVVASASIVTGVPLLAIGGIVLGVIGMAMGGVGWLAPEAFHF